MEGKQATGLCCAGLGAAQSVKEPDQVERDVDRKAHCKRNCKSAPLSFGARAECVVRVL